MNPLITALVGISLAQAIGSAGCAASEPPPVVINVRGGWQATFEGHSSILECRHTPSGTCVKGKLTFSATGTYKPTRWNVQPSRDGVAQRLAVVDDRDNVQGYVTITGDAMKLVLTVVHRPPNTYGGELRFAPEIDFGSRAFACRTRWGSECAVVQMASGPADSLLNDSLFDGDRDLLLRLNGQQVAISTHQTLAGGAIRFQASLRAEVSKPDVAPITIELLPDYYRSRYVPKYRLIDRRRCPSAPTGWMAWNSYFDAATEDDNLAEARVGARFLKPFGLEFWQVESWQENSPRLPVSSFHNLTLRSSPEKFPHGMKWLADQIRALGFRPGLWTVSFGTGDENFYRAHRDWFLHDAKGQPMRNWSGRYVLDPSQAAVRQFAEQTHRVMSAEWGYELFKCDGMSGRNEGLSAHFLERPAVRAAFREPVADAFGLWIETLRRGIGSDRVFMACQGHYTGVEVAWADAARIGGDLIHSPPHPPDWASYLRQAQATQSQLFMNNLVWFNDPDTLMVGEFAPIGVARLATTVVALPGQLTFFGDKLAKLSPERMRLLQQSLPVCDVRPMDLLPLHDLKPVWDLKIRRPFASWDVVSLFNWGNEPTTRPVTFDQLGLDQGKDYLLYEFWSHKFLGSQRGQFGLRVEPRSNLLLAIHVRLGHPQFLSTDRHVSQGGVELTDMTWNEERAELACAFKLVQNDPLTAFFHVPPPFVFAEAAADSAEIQKTSADAGSLISVTLRRATTGEAKLCLRFHQ